MLDWTLPLTPMEAYVLEENNIARNRQRRFKHTDGLGMPAYRIPHDSWRRFGEEWEDLQSDDAEIRKKAALRFYNHSDSEPFRLQ